MLTKDERIRYRPLELNALKHAGLRVFVLVAGNLRGADIAEIFASAIDRILEVCEETRGLVYFTYTKTARCGKIC